MQIVDYPWLDPGKMYRIKELGTLRRRRKGAPSGEKPEVLSEGFLGLSYDKVRRVFEKEPGVIIEKTNGKKGGEYASVFLIPGYVILDWLKKRRN